MYGGIRCWRVVGRDCRERVGRGCVWKNDFPLWADGFQVHQDVGRHATEPFARQVCLSPVMTTASGLVWLEQVHVRG